MYPKPKATVKFKKSLVFHQQSTKKKKNGNKAYKLVRKSFRIEIEIR